MNKLTRDLRFLFLYRMMSTETLPTTIVTKSTQRRRNCSFWKKKKRFFEWVMSNWVVKMSFRDYQRNLFNLRAFLNRIHLVSCIIFMNYSLILFQSNLNSSKMLMCNQKAPSWCQLFGWSHFQDEFLSSKHDSSLYFPLNQSYLTKNSRLNIGWDWWARKFAKLIKFFEKFTLEMFLSATRRGSETFLVILLLIALVGLK